MLWSETNRVLERLSKGEMVLGIQIRSRSPLLAELAGELGYDFLYIETEHFAYNEETIESLVRAAQLTGITPWVRILDLSAERIGHMLDIGVQGVIIPHLEDAEQAVLLRDAVKYPPLGHRGSGGTSRSAGFGCVEAKHYMETSNRLCMAIGMIETVKAVENLEEILASGIDMIRVGRSDLSLDMGLTGKQKDPRFVETLRYITATAAKYHVPVGTAASDPEQAAYFRDLGFQCLSLGSDLEQLKRSMAQTLSGTREACGEI